MVRLARLSCMNTDVTLLPLCPSETVPFRRWYAIMIIMLIYTRVESRFHRLPWKWADLGGVQFRLSDSMLVCTNIFTCPRGSWERPQQSSRDGLLAGMDLLKISLPFRTFMRHKVWLKMKKLPTGSWISKHPRCFFLFASYIFPTWTLKRISLGTGRLLGAVSSKINTACNTCPVIWLVMWWRETSSVVLFPSFNANIRRPILMIWR